MASYLRVTPDAPRRAPGHAGRRHRVLVVRPVSAWRAVTLKTAVAVLLLSSVGCATAPTPQTITDTKQLVGLWRGSIPCRDCPRHFPASLLIRGDATWTVSVDQSIERARIISVGQGSLHGLLGIVDGVLRWGQDGRWYGRVTVVEHRGYEYLSILQPDAPHARPRAVPPFTPPGNLRPPLAAGDQTATASPENGTSKLA